MAHSIFAHHRERGAHERRGEEKRDRRESKTDDGANHKTLRPKTVEENVQSFRNSQKAGKRESRNGDPHFETNVGEQGTSQSINPSAKRPTAESQARHKRGDHDGDRLGGGAKSGHHHADPNHLIDKAGHARNKKQHVDRKRLTPIHPPPPPNRHSIERLEILLKKSRALHSP
jgi:hypothetical protein